jgi:hypothetical protein
VIDLKKPLLVLAGIAGATGVAYLLTRDIKKVRAPANSKKKDAAYDRELAIEEVDEFDQGGQPLLGASGDCVQALYKQDRVSDQVRALMNPAARAVVTPPNGRYTWSDNYGIIHSFEPGYTVLKPEDQIKVFKMAVAMLSSTSRSTQSITTRNILKSILPECNWDVPLFKSFGHEPLPKRQYNMWTSVWYLVKAASKQVGQTIGGQNPSKSLMIPVGNDSGLIIGRGFLGLPDIAVPGTLNLASGQRVELIGGDYRKSELSVPPFFHAEPLFARVISSYEGRPTVEIIGEFQGKDVSPKFAHRHGFDVGRVLRLPGTGTTAVRRVFPLGVE